MHRATKVLPSPRCHSCNYNYSKILQHTCCSYEKLLFLVHLQNYNLCLDPVPLKLFGEGNYAITDIKEVKVTEEFLGPDGVTRGCHRNSELDHCGIKTFLEKAKLHCGCITNSLRRFFPEEKVSSVN